MVRHKVYVTIDEYDKYGYVGETTMNAHHRKIDNVTIYVNADTDNSYDESSQIHVNSEPDEVSMKISEGRNYVLDLRGFKGKIILTGEQLTNISSDLIASEIVE